MRIAIVSTWDTLCGLALYIRDFANELLRLGHEAKVFSETDIPNVQRITVPPHIPYEKVWNRNLPHFRYLAEKIKEWAADWAYFVFEPQLFGVDNRFRELVYLLHRKDVKVAVDLEVPLELHSEYFNKTPVDAYIIITQYDDVDLPRSHLLPFPVREYTHTSQSEARTKLGIPLKSKMALNTGFMREASGINEILTAFQKVVQKVPKAIVVFAGGVHPFDSDRWIRQGKMYAESLGLLDRNVFFTEKIHSEKELQLYGAATDIYVNYRKHYYWRIVGGAAMRAVSSKKPLVAFDCYSVRNLTDGVAFVEDPEQMAKEIVKLFTCPPCYARLQEGVAKLFDKHSWVTVAPQIIGILENS